MEVAIIILAHKSPDQLSRLIDSLDHEKIRCYIHVDKKSNIEKFISVTSKERKAKVVFLKKRYDGRWGGLGLVKATLEAIKVGLSDNNAFHFVLLSGQDYPIVSVDKIISFLEQHRDSNYIEYREFNKQNWPKQLDRVNSYSIRLLGRVYTYPYKGKLSLKQRLLYQIFKLLYPIPRKLPYYMKPFYGSQWWGLTAKTCQEIINFLQEHPAYLEYHEYSFIPDEFFFQTILLNFKHFKKEQFIDHNLHFIKWKDGSPHPNILTINDYDEISVSERLFARKFDTSIDSKILDRLDYLYKTDA